MTDRYGPPEVVRVEEAPIPEPGPHEVLVRVAFSTVNRTDCGYRAARPSLIRLVAGLRAPRRTVLGTELAGDVVAVGSAVASLAVGDRVFGYVEGTFGAHAEYCAVAEDAPVALVPDGVALEAAAAATEGAHYALSFIRTARVAPGQRVLVHGATGGIGSAAVQLLVGQGVRVTATSDTAHLDLVRGLGPDRVVDWQATDFTRDAEVYDAVLDAVGKSTFGRCRRLLAPGGTYLSSDLGPFAQNPLLAVTTPLLRRRTVRFPLPRQDRAMVRRLAALLADGTFRPVIDRRYPLEEIAEAYRYVESGRKVGNVLLTMPGESTAGPGPTG